MKTNKMCAILGNVHRYEALEPLTAKRPIATLPFDCKYRLIDFPLSAVRNANIDSVFMVFNEGETQSVFDHIRGGKEWNLDTLKNRYFLYFYQEFEKKRARGENYYASLVDYLQKSQAPYTVIMGSKMLCNIDLRSVLRVHEKQNNHLTVVYKKVEPEMIDDHDTVLTLNENNQISASHLFNEKEDAHEKENLCMDIFIADTTWLIDFLQQAERDQGEPAVSYLLDAYLAKVPTTVYEYTGYLSNISSITAYFKANMDMLDPTKFSALLYSNQKIYTKIKNEVPTYYAPNSVVKNSQSATGGMIEGRVENSLLGRQVNVMDGAKVKNAIIMSNCKILEDATIEYAILDKNVIVDAHVKIIGTPENPVVIPKGARIIKDVYGIDVLVEKEGVKHL
ncbi:glucose-1-phosphate adenylyltransferase subunit GlgD [Enterococcus timonensis]|uniref:glucose-1-phosphate adenylyltransferase subunit GlgD n=1 Tax=Enterococcus timonensis TaxID=1852364 RepID=UPI0008DA5027|nr:glucose-1-phosphate adenylyltransferase subunit GlgD [Enterococcus timonensis]